MKKLLFLYMLSLFSAANTGIAYAQPGVKYPYVEKDAKGNACIIVCEDYKGGFAKGYLLTYESMSHLHQYGESDRSNNTSRLSPKFRVAVKDVSTEGSYRDTQACKSYREDPDDNDYTWRLPTAWEIRVIYTMWSAKRLTGIDDFQTDGRPYWTSDRNDLSLDFNVGSLIDGNYRNFRSRCVRDLTLPEALYPHP